MGRSLARSSYPLLAQQIKYLLRAQYLNQVADPAISPVAGELGKVELTHPNSKFYLNRALFCRANGTGANFDTFAIGTNSKGQAFTCVNGSLAGIKLASIASKGVFSLGSSKGGNTSPRFEWEHVAGSFSLAGIRNTSGTFTSVSRTKTNPVMLWFLWTDKLYFGLNDEIIFAQAIAPSGSRYPIISRQLITGEWRNYMMAWSNGFKNFITGKTAPYSLNAGEFAKINQFFETGGGDTFIVAP